MYKMPVYQFIALAKQAAQSKTLYVKGCFGDNLRPSVKSRYINNNQYNTQSARAAKIKAADSSTFGFDCVCLIKGILWGWKGDLLTSYGGAIYKSNSVPDLNADQMANMLLDRSTDFTNIIPGEMVHMPGHCGVYIGDGLVIECTPKWDDGVQVTALGNWANPPAQYHARAWKTHGKLPYVDYTPETQAPVPDPPAEWAAKAWDRITQTLGRDGKPVMDGTRPTDNITRQELATVLYRLGLMD